MATESCPNCKTTIVVTVLKGFKVFYDRRGNAIESCIKCGQSLK
jgi:hypothetical protein